MKHELRKAIILFSGIVLLLANPSFATTRTATVSGNLNNPSTWLPSGIPVAGDDIVVPTGIIVTVLSNQTIHNLTVNGGGILNWGGAYKLSLTGSITVNGTVVMTGDLALITPGTAFVLGANSSFAWKPADNTLAGATLFTNGIENFSSTSTLIIQRWYDYSVPLASTVTGNFGNLELNSLSNSTIYEWNQNNEFETHRILGTLSVDQGWITLDKSGSISNTTIGNIVLKNANSSLYCHNGNHRSSFTVTTSSLTNNGGIFYGLNDGDGNLTIHTTGDFTNLGNTKIITNSGMTNLANGNATLIVDGTFSQSAGDTRILYNVTTSNSGIFAATFNKLTLTGGIFMGQTACRMSGGICSFTVTNDFTVNFASPSDKFRTTSLSSINSNMNNVEVNFSVGGNLHLSGHSVSEFTSTASAGKETATIHGDLIIDGTDASFNYGTIQASHDNNLTIDGNIIINNGSTFFSRNNGNATITANGNLSITSGTLSLKGGMGASILNLLKNYSQSGGTVYIHNNTTTPTADAGIMNVSGDFTQSSGTINFDNNSSINSAAHILNLRGSNYTISGGTMTHTGAGTCTAFGQLNFAANGTMNFYRTGNAHLITQVKQNIKAGCKVDVQDGDVQIASHQASATNYFRIEHSGRLELKSSHIFSNALYINSGMQVDSAGELALRHSSGLYNGTTQAAISADGNMNFFLHPSSVVEYGGNGNFSQYVTGIGIGIATSTQHKYGILRIKTVGAEAKTVSVIMAGVCVRTQLQLVKGELSLNGQDITIENGNPNAIIRTSGYIKNALTTGAFICWKNISSGTHVFPFGVTAARYIPVTFIPTSGMGNDISVTTYSTNTDNWPYPLYNPPLNFPSNTYPATDLIDRWWMFRARGITADVTLSYCSNERTITADADAPLGAIQWHGTGWTPPLGTSSAIVNSIGTVNVKYASMFTAWTIASKVIPVSYDLAFFNGEQIDELVYLKWVTNSEFNSAHFSVERSEDGNQFEEINKVSASGRSDSPLHYSSIDRNPVKGTAWYRLKQIDTEGKSVYSAPIKVNYNDSKPSNIEIENFGPNPFENNFQVTYRITKEGLVRFQLASSTGEVLHSSELNSEKGSHQFNYDGGAILAPGIYFLKLMYADKVVTQKLIKK